MTQLTNATRRPLRWGFLLFEQLFVVAVRPVDCACSRCAVMQELRKENAQFEREFAQLKAQLEFKDRAISDLSALTGSAISPTADASSTVDPKVMLKMKTENEELHLKVR